MISQQIMTSSMSKNSNSSFFDLSLTSQEKELNDVDNKDIQEQCLLSDLNDENKDIKVVQDFFGDFNKTENRFKKKAVPQFDSPQHMNILDSDIQITEKPKNRDKKIKNELSQYLFDQKPEFNIKKQEQHMNLRQNFDTQLIQSDDNKFEWIPKSLKKLQKEKQIFINLDPAIKSFFQKQNYNASKKKRSCKLNVCELTYLVKFQKLRKYEEKLIHLQQKMTEIMNDMIKQKRKFQQEISQMDEINKNVVNRLEKMQDRLMSLQDYYCDSANTRNQVSFSKISSTSKNKQQFFENISFAKTFISSIQQLEIKQVQEQQNAQSHLQKGLIQFLYILKKKTDCDIKAQISEGLINRVASGHTLRKWIKQISQHFLQSSKVSQFTNPTEWVNQFLQILTTNQQHFISKINATKNHNNEYQKLELSCWLTFIGLILDDFASYGQQMKEQKKQEIYMNTGKINRFLNIVGMKTGINESQFSQFISQVKTIVNKLIAIL